jgi:hypothetical protein
MTDLATFTARYVVFLDGEDIASGTTSGKTPGEAERRALYRGESIGDNYPEDRWSVWVDLARQVCESDGTPSEPFGRCQ